jgi:hypothetical protein
VIERKALADSRWPRTFNSFFVKKSGIFKTDELPDSCFYLANCKSNSLVLFLFIFSWFKLLESNDKSGLRCSYQYDLFLSVGQQLGSAESLIFISSTILLVILVKHEFTITNFECQFGVFLLCNHLGGFEYLLFNRRKTF